MFSLHIRISLDSSRPGGVHPSAWGQSARRSINAVLPLHGTGYTSTGYNKAFVKSVTILPSLHNSHQIILLEYHKILVHPHKRALPFSYRQAAKDQVSCNQEMVDFALSHSVVRTAAIWSPKQTKQSLHDASRRSLSRQRQPTVIIPVVAPGIRPHQPWIIFSAVHRFYLRFIPCFIPFIFIYPVPLLLIISVCIFSLQSPFWWVVSFWVV